LRSLEQNCDVSVGSKADKCSALVYVCFGPNADISSVREVVRRRPNAFELVFQGCVLPI
jgi:hypothetical protein